MSGEVATQTMTAPRRRGGQLRRFAPVWGEVLQRTNMLEQAN